MGSVEVMAFIAAAVVVGALTMGGVTLVYFRDKWREDTVGDGTATSRKAGRASPFDRAA